MLRYALQTLAARKASFVGAFVALACAAALVTACGTLLETGLRGDIDTERYAAAPVVVAGDQDVHHDEDDGDETKHKAKPINERVWLPADLVDRIADAPGVRAAVPEVSFPAAVAAPGTGTFAAGPDDRPSLGHAWGSAVLAPLTIDAGAAPTADDEIVVDRGLASRAGVAVGDRVTVQATGAPTEYRVVGIATTSSTPSGGLEQQSAIFFSEDEARRLAGHPDEVAVIGVLPEAGVTTGELTQQVEAALDGTTAQVHRDDLGAVEFLDASQARVELISMGGALAGTGIVVATLVVVGTFALAIQQRERELALLRAIAATPRQVRRLIGREALLVGTAAGLPGAAAGWLLAGWLYERFVDLGTIPETMAIVRSPFPVIGAVAATLLTAWLAARISARRTARIRPAEALSEAAAEPARLPVGRLLAGALVLAGAVVILLVLRALHTEPAAMPVTYLVVLVLASALALLGPLVARVAATVSGVGLRALPVTGHLAAKNGRANARRLATVVTPIALLVGMACTVVFIQTTLGDAAARQAGEGVTADWVIGSSGPGVPADAVDRLRRTPGVVAVTEMVHTTVRSPGLAEYTVQGVTPRGLSSTVDLGVTDGSLDALDADGVAISEVVADSTGLRPGDGMDLVMGDGTPVDLTVVAVYERASVSAI